LSAELTKTHSFRLVFLPIFSTGKCEREPTISGHLILLQRSLCAK